MSTTVNPALTAQQYAQALEICRSLYIKKLQDYGAAWRILRPESLTDQLYIKVMRIRSIERIGEARVQEGIVTEFIAIVNYALMGLIQLYLGTVDAVDLDNEAALEYYNKMAETTYRLMLDKNHDYGEAWRSMRISSFTDMILSKVLRTKQIEDHNGATLVSEGVSANYMDIANYALFALIRLSEEV